MSRWPFLITFRENVFGNGFLADVRGQGKALGVCEGEKDFWLYGVNPGALAAGGETGTEAHFRFVQEFKTVLYDIAEGAKDFNEFQREVEKFFHESNSETSMAWQAAVQDIKDGRGAAADPTLPRKPAETPVSVTVSPLDMSALNASENALELGRALAA